jgi:hypothetical protein
MADGLKGNFCAFELDVGRSMSLLLMNSFELDQFQGLSEPFKSKEVAEPTNRARIADRTNDATKLRK